MRVIITKLDKFVSSKDKTEYARASFVSPVTGKAGEIFTQAKNLLVIKDNDVVSSAELSKAFVDCAHFDVDYNDQGRLEGVTKVA